MDILERRQLLMTKRGPGGVSEYISALEGTFPTEQETLTINVLLRYVPGTDVLIPTSFANYLHKISTLDWPTHEGLAAAIRDDAMDVLIARWVQVVLTAEGEPGEPVHRQRVILEDRAPKWDNAKLLARLELY